MKHTNETLSQLSEKQIDELVALIKNSLVVVTGGTGSGLGDYRSAPHYCEQPELIMPIAFENKITVGPYYVCENKDVPNFHAFVDFCDEFILVHNENPLRAICCVFILMNQ
jgi:hypothetical protein